MGRPRGAGLSIPTRFPALVGQPGLQQPKLAKLAQSPATMLLPAPWGTPPQPSPACPGHPNRGVGSALRGAVPGHAAVAEAALLTERSGLQHWHGHVGGDAFHPPEFGEDLQGAPQRPPGCEITQPVHLGRRERLHPSLGCELPQKALITFSEPRGLCQYLTAVFVSADGCQ